MFNIIPNAYEKLKSTIQIGLPWAANNIQSCTAAFCIQLEQVSDEQENCSSQQLFSVRYTLSQNHLYFDVKWNMERTWTLEPDIP